MRTDLCLLYIYTYIYIYIYTYISNLYRSIEEHLFDQAGPIFSHVFFFLRGHHSEHIPSSSLCVFPGYLPKSDKKA